MQQAFDSAPYKEIIVALSTAGTSGRLLLFVRNFILRRRMKMRVGGAIRESRNVMRGVPQGRVLSPLLFNCVISGLLRHLPQKCDFPIGIAACADDIALWISGPSHRGQRLHASLQRALNATAEYWDEVGLQISPAKSAAIAYHPKQRAHRTMSRL